MNKLALIRVLGDALAAIDTAIGSLLPSDPHQQQLQELRALLDDQQRKLSQQAFEENTPAFQSAARQLKEVNDEIQTTVREVQRIEAVIDNIKRFVDSVATLLGPVVPA
jgi:hypothetical protein